MTVFDTPDPVSLVLDVAAGNVRITASDRADTVVEVRATDPGDASAAAAADAARIVLDAGRLTVDVGRPRHRGLRDLFRSGTVEVAIDLPEGSDVRGSTSIGDVRCVGRLGACRLRSEHGDVRVDDAGPLQVATTNGTIDVDRTTGPADLTSQHGDIRVRRVDGPATIRNTHGETEIGEVTGDLRLTGVNGEIDVARALGDVEARTAHGGIRIGEVVRGSVSLTSAHGELEIGVAAGTAAWLDLGSASGEVWNELGPADGPGPSDETVEVRARTAGGGIHVHRA